MAARPTPPVESSLTKSANESSAIVTSVKIYDNGDFVGDADVAGDQWSLRIDKRLVGRHSIQAASGVQSNVWQFDVTSPLVAPQITSVTGPGGSLGNPGITSDRTLTFTGTSSPNASVELLDSGALIGSTTANNSGTWSVTVTLAYGSYGVTARTSGGQSAPAWVITIQQALAIDTSVLILNGQIVHVGHTPTHPPANTSATRTASGGTPPYRYSVSTRVVDIDPTTGKVVSAWNGAGVVTATDSQGASVSYPVQVSNVSALDGWVGNQTYRYAVSNAQAAGGHLPSLAEMRAMRVAYGGAPGLPGDAGEGAAWTSTPGGQGYITIVPNTGVEGSQPDVVVIIGGRGVAKGWAILARNVTRRPQRSFVSRVFNKVLSWIKA